MYSSQIMNFELDLKQNYDTSVDLPLTNYQKLIINVLQSQATLQVVSRRNYPAAEPGNPASGK